jgi:hypothetical protein
MAVPEEQPALPRERDQGIEAVDQRSIVLIIEDLKLIIDADEDYLMRRMRSRPIRLLPPPSRPSTSFWD